MATSDPRWRQLLAAFSAELDERVRDLNQLLLRLERNEGGEGARGETFDALFRQAHNLKGAARAVELRDIEQLAHALESALDAARRSGGAEPPGWFDAMYGAADAFGALYRAALENAPTPPELAAALAALEGQPAGALPPPTAELPPTEAPPEPIVEAPPDSTPARPLSQPVEPPVAPSPVENGGRSVAAQSVRVDAGKLDALLAQSGELAVTHIRIEQRQSELRDLRVDLDAWRREWRRSRELRSGVRRAAGGEGSAAALDRETAALLRFVELAEQRALQVLQQVEQIGGRLRSDAAQLGLISRAMEDAVISVRLAPVANLFSPYERMVRDLTREMGKEVRLVQEGGDTEIDRKILENLRDPLMHMLRNAMDHGIERPEERIARGKPRQGAIRLTAAQRGNMIEIELEDDGAGLDPVRLRQSAVRKGMMTEEQAAALDERAARDLIFSPGFSTSTTVTGTSGRGVGMDVVRENVERLNGHITIASTPGWGTRFTISVPLTLATTRAVLVELGTQLFAVPSSMIERTGRVKEANLVSLEGALSVALEGHPVPVVELAGVLERPHTGQPGEWRHYFVLRQGDRRVALLADRLVGEQEIVIKSLGWPLRRLRNVSGAAVLGTGQTVVILNPTGLLKSALRLLGGGVRAASGPVAQPVERRRKRLLVVDDSVTTRTLEKSILEAAGYDVVVAADGIEALSVLRSEPIDLAVSDVEMPRLDGFGLTMEIRRDEKLRRLPVVLVTSLEAREHRERGVAAGADAYIVKSGFDQGQLLDTVSRLL